MLKTNIWHYSTPGPVATWTGDCLQTGKSSPYVTNHPGQLSLLSFTGL